MKMPNADYKPIRDGVVNMKAEAKPAHPVEQIQQQVLFHRPGPRPRVQQRRTYPARPL